MTTSPHDIRATGEVARLDGLSNKTTATQAATAPPTSQEKVDWRKYEI